MTLMLSPKKELLLFGHNYARMTFFHLSSIIAVLRSFQGLFSSAFASFVSSTFLATCKYEENLNPQTFFGQLAGTSGKY